MQMNPTRKPRSSVASLFRYRSTDKFFLSEAEFSFAADYERRRVDRSGSAVSFLLIQVARGKSAPDDMAFLARVLRRRLRTTDTSGMMKDGRVGVILPDTPAEGAWKVAADVSEVYAPGPGRPEVEVFTHPDRGRPSSDDALLEDVGEQRKTDPPEPAEHNDEVETGEVLFAQGTPFWKRALDICGSVVGLSFAAPLLIPAAIAIKLTSRGPIFFRQEREGRSGKPFQILKLRTMYTDAEERKKDMLHLSQQDGPAFKMENDPRITPIGNFLRWSSIDELPQFLNVLTGDMSLVGPRPLPTQESQACEDWQRRRLAVKPGMTCTWQVFGRGRVRFDEWVRMDLRYADNSSAWTDLKLLFITLPSLVFQRGMR